MTTSRIYMYPRASAGLRKLTIPQQANDFQVGRRKLGGASMTLAGSVIHTPVMGYDTLRFVVERRSERLASLSQWRNEAHTLIDHLQRGGAIGVALDVNKAVCCSVTTAAPGGSSTVTISGNLFTSYESAADLAADDRVVLSSSNPERAREEHSLSAFTLGTSATFDRVVDYDHSGKIILRHWGFYPSLRLDPDRAREELTISERGFVFTLSLPLVEDVETMESVILGLSTVDLADEGVNIGVGEQTLESVAGLGRGSSGGSGQPTTGAWLERSRASALEQAARIGYQSGGGWGRKP